MPHLPAAAARPARAAALVALLLAPAPACRTAPPPPRAEPALPAASARPSPPPEAPAPAAAPAHGSGGTSADGAELVVCSQNLWNYGLPEEVRRLRRTGASPGRVRDDLDRQESVLAARLAACDIVAVQEIVGEDETRALAALQRLAARLEAASGRAWQARVADSADVIRNGFLYRADGRLREIGFTGSHTSQPLPDLHGFGRVSWERGPAELLVELPAVPAAPGAPAVRVRVITAHLKSKFERREGEGPRDRHGEKWERRRVLQAAGLLELARRRMEEDPSELLLLAGDFNNGRGSATQAVLSGEIAPAALLSPADCIDGEGLVACDLPRRAPLLVNLLAGDPDLAGLGSFLFAGREDLLDSAFASPAAARLALEPGGAEGDFDVALEGRIREGSDHRMVRVRLRLRGAAPAPGQ